MDNNLDIYEEKRPWGSFRRFTNNTLSTVKILTVNPHEELSIQSHLKRREFWRVIKGSGVFNINEESFDVTIGDERFIPFNIKHQIKGGPSGMEVLEISLGEFDEDDIVRYEDKYGRI